MQVMGAGQGPGLPASGVGCPREAAGASASWARDGAAGADGHSPRVQPGGQSRSASPLRPRVQHGRGHSPGPQGPGGTRTARPCPQHAPTRHHTPNSRQETPREMPRKPNIPESPTGGKQPGGKQTALNYFTVYCIDLPGLNKLLHL